MRRRVDRVATDKRHHRQVLAAHVHDAAAAGHRLDVLGTRLQRFDDAGEWHDEHFLADRADVTDIHGTAGCEFESHAEIAATGKVTEIDSRLTGRARLETIIHEALHLACPWMMEYAVLKVARYIAMIVWHCEYRREIENDG